MQAENNKNNIKTLSFGCRLNALESEKIKHMLGPIIDAAIVVNTCSVTGEAERQSAQSIRRTARENPEIPIFVTGCAATRNPGLFMKINNVFVIPNADKMNCAAYTNAIRNSDFNFTAHIDFGGDQKLSKQFIQIQNGCNHDCTYCVTRLLRGTAVSFPYAEILHDAQCAVKNGFHEIILTGVDSASYVRTDNGNPFLLSDLCTRLLSDVSEIQRLRLSSVDPASPEIPKIIELIHNDARMMGHLHLSMQSGSDTILAAMRRRHTTAHVRNLMHNAHGITFGWDIICGFPGETDELFRETCELAAETHVIKIHAFPFSPRPGTVAADMPNQIPHNIAKRRVHEITAIANGNRNKYMVTQVGKRVSVLVENNNVARTADDIPVRIADKEITPRTICDVTISDICNGEFIGHIDA
ncbi:MAG: MiaB/RimO family radical SAM methylthiotransferase [Alphaproteobacteria bacterium]|nr:MiaB/RimO family radical SAM methylthiotransferase [Alphaproteobacteria bacterium]